MGAGGYFSGKWADFYFGDSIWSTTEFSKGHQNVHAPAEKSQLRTITAKGVPSSGESLSSRMLLSDPCTQTDEEPPCQGSRRLIASPDHRGRAIGIIRLAGHSECGGDRLPA